MSVNANDITVIIDTGCANLSSVKYAFERLNANVVVTAEHAQIKAATRVVLPGVGTAGAAMDALNNRDLVTVIKSLTQPILGVCLGMQMLSALSKEHGGRAQSNVECLNVIPTQITALNSQGLPLPHMGWNQIQVGNHPLFKGIANGSYVYFVHSFKAPISQYTLAQCEYGETFSAAIGNGNFFGVQFHPEKSAQIGAQILQNFLNMGTSQ
ncbi:imidazole glycerol phosphate synthase subunit HisH [Shewanella intestini]|uniref:Imidazole glycerol phosphate synthase subunit HisH n=1 Tax=Shewanella intestini TaxID=2017544 RepID=A0ABS5HZ62_9GAMM|nr:MULTISPECIES: imidazole glycerol phosphate synthase subunit HisH [Shewanella]MBR9727078.1 imidazole glycerol phosphate synthase subunit HisH [Shewanella intestini]MRG35880.1 imidazole glycerol phosphate synthase subunit HisH [Shewanella sp. XMDDZSB0408]